MKFGIDYFPDVQPDRVSGQQYFADVLDLAEEADRLGYDNVKTVERTRRLRMVTGAGRTGAAGHRWTADGRPAAPR